MNDVISISMVNTMIHTTAIIDPTATIAENVKIGPYSIIGPHVTIGEGTIIESHVSIDCWTDIGCNNHIYSYAALGGDPQDINYHGEETHLVIGDSNLIREFVTISRGSSKGTKVTHIGNNNMFMAYSHIGHDCIIGNYTVLVNTASLAGHVHLDDHVMVGAFCGIHQFVHIGAYAFITRGALVTQNVLPYSLVANEIGGVRGLNIVGLRRKGFSNEAILRIKEAYHIVFDRGLKLEDAKAELQKMLPNAPEIEAYIKIIEASGDRSIAR